MAKSEVKIFFFKAEDGKTEMSLVHFTITNPGWKPSLDSEKYLTGKQCFFKK